MNVREIAATAERLVPDATTRKAILRTLAKTIALVHEARPAGWGITLVSSKKLRLNLGGIEVFVWVFGSGVFCLVDHADALPLQKSLPATARLNDGGHYRSIPTASAVFAAEGDWPTVYDAFQRAHQTFIGTAAAKYKSYPFKRSHSEDLLAYVARETGKAIARPAWTTEREPQIEIPPLKELVARFRTSYANTPEGRAHLARYPAEREWVRRWLPEIELRSQRGEDVTELVLTKLIPHQDTPYNRERGAWCSVWSVVRRDIKGWFEGADWVVDPAGWPEIAAAVLKVLSAVIETEKPEALEAFAASDFSRGFSVGFLTPVFASARPDRFVVLNSKARKTATYCLDELDLSGDVSPQLVEYLDANALIRDGLLPKLKEIGIENADEFDAFCHWMCDRRLGGYLSKAGPSVEPDEDEADDADEGIAGWIFRGKAADADFGGGLHKGYVIEMATDRRSERGWLRAEAEIGDPVFLYLGVPRREIVALGRVISRVEDSEDRTRCSVEVMTDLLQNPVSIREIQAEPKLEDLRINRAYAGGIMPVADDELPFLARIVVQKNPELKALLPHVAEAPAPQAASAASRQVLDLSAWVERWLKESGYPTERDRRECEQRARWAELLSPERISEVTPETFRPIYQLGAYGSTGPMSVLNQFFIDATDSDLNRFRETLRVTLHGAERPSERLDRALDQGGKYWIKGLGESVLMKCLAITDPAHFLGVYPYTGDNGKESMLRLLGLPPPPTGSRGMLASRSNDDLIGKLRPHFKDQPGLPATHAMRRFLYWLKPAFERPDPTVEINPADRFLRDTSWLAARLNEVSGLLERRGQLIFYGPPGTGKTYVARRLAEYFAGSPARVQLVQFHPSYGYEDFVEGLRPVAESGQLSYRIEPGILLKWAQAAAAAPEQKFVLVIDEINRASLPRVFGELLFLLEYRRDHVLLPVSKNYFELPENLFFVGTMNTADRSIAQIDVALRRRFHFVRLDPDADVLAKRLTSSERPEEFRKRLVDGFIRLNVEITKSLGHEFCVGHSFFMRDDLDDAVVERIWRHDIEPLLEDYFYDQRPRIAEMRRALFLTPPLGDTSE